MDWRLDGHRRSDRVGEPYLFSVAAWERPTNDLHWRVDAATVEAAVAAAVERYEVVEIACDPHEWRAQLQAWSERGSPVSEWPTNSLPRMVPAWKEFYAAVLEKRITHDGDPAVARHVANAVLKVDKWGAHRPRNTPARRKIDRLIAAIIARDLAVALAGEPPAAVPEFFAL